MSTDPTYKKCPFCNSSNVGKAWSWGYCLVWITCFDCGSCGPKVAGNTPENDASIQAANKWNARCESKQDKAVR